jgi:hypothetical protein
MLYLYILEDHITDANTEEGSTISTSEKEDLSTGLFLLEFFLFFHENKLLCICPVYDIGFKVLFMRISYLVSGQTKDYQIGICCFSAMHAVLRSKSKDCLAPNQENVSEWGDMSILWYLQALL